jgi:hypothetical protein
MAKQERLTLIDALEKARNGRLLISYITSTRTNWEVQIADDVVAHLYRHLEAGKAKAEKGVDLFIHSNGGSGTAPWRIVNVVREYTNNLAVLVPQRCFQRSVRQTQC